MPFCANSYVQVKNTTQILGHPQNSPVEFDRFSICLHIIHDVKIWSVSPHSYLADNFCFKHLLFFGFFKCVIDSGFWANRSFSNSGGIMFSSGSGSDVAFTNFTRFSIYTDTGNCCFFLLNRKTEGGSYSCCRTNFLNLICCFSLCNLHFTALTEAIFVKLLPPFAKDQPWRFHQSIPFAVTLSLFFWLPFLLFYFQLIQLWITYLPFFGTAFWVSVPFFLLKKISLLSDHHSSAVAILLSCCCWTRWGSLKWWRWH